MMTYKSKAQMRMMHAMAERGEMPMATVAEYDKASKGKKLPERVKPKAKGKKKFRSLKDALR